MKTLVTTLAMTIAATSAFAVPTLDSLQNADSAISMVGDNCGWADNCVSSIARLRAGEAPTAVLGSSYGGGAVTDAAVTQLLNDFAWNSGNDLVALHAQVQNSIRTGAFTRNYSDPAVVANLTIEVSAVESYYTNRFNTDRTGSGELLTSVDMIYAEATRLSASNGASCSVGTYEEAQLFESLNSDTPIDGYVAYFICDYTIYSPSPTSATGTDVTPNSPAIQAAVDAGQITRADARGIHNANLNEIAELQTYLNHNQVIASNGGVAGQRAAAANAAWFE